MVILWNLPMIPQDKQVLDLKTISPLEKARIESWHIMYGVIMNRIETLLIQDTLPNRIIDQQHGIIGNR